MIIVGGYIDMENEAEIAAILEAGNEMVADTLKEAGCVDYCFAIDIGNPCRIRLFEVWIDQAALDAHMQTPHMAKFMGAIMDAKRAGASVSAYDAKGATKLM
jgi:quinol monooxygenase YgiN